MSSDDDNDDNSYDLDESAARLSESERLLGLTTKTENIDQMEKTTENVDIAINSHVEHAQYEQSEHLNRKPTIVDGMAIHQSDLGYYQTNFDGIHENFVFDPSFPPLKSEADTTSKLTKGF